MKKFIRMGTCFFIILGSCTSAFAQNKSTKPSLSAWDGMIVAGYVNQGSYINFGGPSIKLVRKPWVFGFGILPTMRLKQDKVAKGTTKNSVISPTAGFGFTFAYSHLVVQIPFYYNPKTTTSNGKWYPGVGLGFRF